MTISAALLLVVLCSGWYFVNTSLSAKYRSARETGQRLYFRVLWYAVLIAFGTSAILFVFQLVASKPAPDVSLGGLLDVFRRYVDFIESPMHKWVAILTLPVSVVLSYLSNRRYQGEEGEEEKGRLVSRIIEGRDFETLVLHAVDSEQPLLLTLDTGKVYVGLVTRVPDPALPREHLRIMPLMSGYRSPETMAVRFTTNYREVVRAAGDTMDSYDFEMVLPSQRIVSAHVFDPDVYEAFVLQEGQGE